MNLKTTVVNLARGEECDVRVHRPSMYGNPYAVDRGQVTAARFVVSTLGEALRAYERWLIKRPDLIGLARATLRGLRLGCFCTTDLTGRGEIVCHAQILARVADGAELPVMPKGGGLSDIREVRRRR